VPDVGDGGVASGGQDAGADVAVTLGNGRDRDADPISSSRSMSMRLYLKNGAPVGSSPCSASQRKTSGRRSAIAPTVCMVTRPLIAT
jgi:hypothetical protein